MCVCVCVCIYISLRKWLIHTSDSHLFLRRSARGLGSGDGAERSGKEACRG